MLNLIVLVFAVPNIAHMIYFKYMKTVYDDPTLLNAIQTLYPAINWTGAPLYGLSDLWDPPQSFALFYYYGVVPILVGFLILFRSRAVNALSNQRDGNAAMSEKTYAMHKLFLQLLTIHALLPVIIGIACASHLLLILGIYNPEIEAFTFLIAMIPPILNPGITIWFIKPYRAYVARILFCNHFKRIFPSGSTSNAFESRVPASEKNKKTSVSQQMGTR